MSLPQHRQAASQRGVHADHFVLLIGDEFLREVFEEFPYSGTLKDVLDDGPPMVCMARNETACFSRKIGYQAGVQRIDLTRRSLS